MPIFIPHSRSLVQVLKFLDSVKNRKEESLGAQAVATL